MTSAEFSEFPSVYVPDDRSRALTALNTLSLLVLASDNPSSLLQSMLYSADARKYDLFTYVRNDIGVCSDDWVDLLRLTEPEKCYRIVEDSDILSSYIASSEEIVGFLSSYLAECYILPERGQNWIIINMDGDEWRQSRLITT